MRLVYKIYRWIQGLFCKKGETLYILGNGFDLHHGLDTWYSSFGLFVKKKHPEIYEHILEYLYLPDLDESNPKTLSDPLWADFEAAFANLDFEGTIESFSEYAANIGDPDFRDRDWGTMGIYIEEVRKNLTEKLFLAFKEFIQGVSYPDKNKVDLLGLEVGARFLSFNYTKTLQVFYGIDSTKINYVHGQAEGSDSLVLGHGFDPESFIPKEETPPPDLSEEDMERWMDWQSENYNHSVEIAKYELIPYFKDSYKPTTEILQKNRDYLNSLKNVTEIFVLGLSMADVDLPYIAALRKSIPRYAHWKISYYRPNEKIKNAQQAEKAGLRLGQYEMIKMTDLLE